MARLRQKRGERSTSEGGSYSKALTGIGHRVNPAEEEGPDAGERPIGGGPGQYDRRGPNADPNRPPRRPNRPKGPRNRKAGGVRSPIS